jgi:predicted anti-sigma-YlaC factor YlaD
MNHPEELLAGYVDGALTDEEQAAVDAHLATCETCREELELAGHAVTALASLEEEPMPFGVMNPVTTEIGRRTRSRRTPWQTRLQWAAGLAAAAAVVALVAIELPHMLGGAGAGSAAMSAASTADLGRGPNAEFEAAAGLEVQSVDYDVARLEALATEVATQVKSGATTVGGSQSSAPPDTVQTALDCLLRASSFTENDRLVRLIEAKFQGTAAYLGVFLESPKAGQPPDQVVIWVVAKKDCSILSFSSKRIT